MTDSCKNLAWLSKAKTYIGFAKKAGKLKIGTDNILAYKKFSDIILSDSISDNAKNKIFNHSQKTNAVVTITSEAIMNAVFDSDNIKAIAVIDKNLATAFINCIKTLEETTVE